MEKARKSGAAPAQALAAEAEIFRVTAYLDHEMRSLRRWTQAAPSDWKPWLKLFYIYLDLNWKREADASSQRVLALAPENARAHVARAVFCYSTAVDARDAAPGIAHARHALALEPDNVAYKNLLATVLVRANRWKEAEGVLRALIAEAPGRTENVMLLYRAVMLQGRKSEAEAVLAGIVRDHPENIEALYEQGVNAFQRKEFEVARTIFERVMAHDVRYARTAFYLGQVYLRQGRAAEGRQLVDGFKALDRNASAYQTAQFRLAARPNDPALHETLGKLYFNAEDYAKAVVEFRRVLDLRPGDAKARMLLRNALNRTGRSFEAEQLAAAKAPAR